MREIVHLQAGQCGNQIGAKVSKTLFTLLRHKCCNLIENAVFRFVGAYALCVALRRNHTLGISARLTGEKLSFTS